MLSKAILGLPGGKDNKNAARRRFIGKVSQRRSPSRQRHTKVYAFHALFPQMVEANALEESVLFYW